MDSQIEIQVECTNTNANTQQHQTDHQPRTAAPTPWVLDPSLSGRVNTLHKAALKGDWKAAEGTVNSDPKINWNIKITKDGNTALHIAVSARQTTFVRNLVECLNESELEFKNRYGYTAFCTAAVSGVVEIAEVMYHKNKNLPAIRSKIPLSKKSGYTPLKIAIWFRKKGMAEYLYPITPLEVLEDEEYMDILEDAIHADMCDIALKMLNESPRIATSTTISTEKALQALAQKDLSYNHKFQGRIWERLVSILATIPCIPYFKGIHSSLQTRRQANELVRPLLDSSILTQETRMLHDAAKIGNVEFLTLITQSFPELTWNRDSKKHSIFDVAVINRQEKVFSLIHQTGADMDFITYYSDIDKNNILHLAGKIAPPSRLNIVSGPALQMQRELQWFKEVEKIVRPYYVQEKNKEVKKTPRELFTMEHEDLRKAGEKWMKATSTSCLVVATLITTVAFAAAFTVPGGNKEETGFPIFLTDGWFTVFVISDAVAMFSSAASIMMFLSILTSRYGEDDFEYSLPAKLMVGLFTLFFSIVFMASTFSATFFMVYKEEKQKTVPILVVALAVLPITLYAVLNCRLWIDLFQSTCWASRYMFQPGKHKLF